MTAIEAGRSTAIKVYKIQLSAGITLNWTMIASTVSLSRNHTMLRDELDFLVQFEMSNMPVQLRQVKSIICRISGIPETINCVLLPYFWGFGIWGFGISIDHRK